MINNCYGKLITLQLFRKKLKKPYKRHQRTFSAFDENVN